MHFESLITGVTRQPTVLRKFSYRGCALFHALKQEGDGGSVCVCVRRGGGWIDFCFIYKIIQIRGSLTKTD